MTNRKPPTGRQPSTSGARKGSPAKGAPTPKTTPTAKAVPSSRPVVGHKPPKSAIAARQASQRAMAAASGARAARRKRLITVLSPVAVVVLVVGILVAVYASSNHGAKSGKKTTVAASAVISDVTSVPLATLNKVGAGTIATPPTTLTGAALTSGGLPRVLYVGAEWCPYCAAERWAVAVAVSRFGTLSGLGETSSSPTDSDPNTASLSFHGATLNSSTIAFSPFELFSNQVSGGTYQALDTLDAADNTLFTTTGKGSYPFVDIGGKYMISGASYDPALLKGKTQAEIATAILDPTSTIGKAIDGTANVITAAICASTNNQPAAVCTSAGVLAGKAKLSA